MHVVSYVRSCKEFWKVINGHVIHPTLHWAKKMMVKVRDVNCLVDHQVIALPSVRVVISDNTRHNLVDHWSSQRWVISFNGDLLVIFLND